MLVMAQSMHAAGPDPSVWPGVAIYAGAAAVFLTGVWFLWGGRRPGSGQEVEHHRLLARWRAGMSIPSRLAVGLSLILLGYHFAAWNSPESWRLLKVPREYWWAVIAGCAALGGGSLVADRFERA
jgi:hypothetical protein